jgi:hypothetical protein
MRKDNDDDRIIVAYMKRQSSSISALNVMSKKLKSIDNVDDELPACLSVTNCSFGQYKATIMNTSNSDQLDGLRQVTVLQYHCDALDIQTQMSMTYLRMGVDNSSDTAIQSTDIDRRYWQQLVKSMMLKQ